MFTRYIQIYRLKDWQKEAFRICEDNIGHFFPNVNLPGVITFGIEERALTIFLFKSNEQTRGFLGCIFQILGMLIKMTRVMELKSSIHCEDMNESFF